VIILVSLIGFLALVYLSITIFPALELRLAGLLVSLVLLVTGAYVGYLGIRVEELAEPSPDRRIRYAGGDAQGFQSESSFRNMSVERLAVELEELKRIQGSPTSSVIARLVGLTDEVRSLNLPAAVEAGMLAALERALVSMKSNDSSAAKTELDDFVRLVKFHRGKSLSESASDDLVNGTLTIKLGLEQPRSD